MPHYSIWSQYWDKSVVVFNALNKEHAEKEATEQFFQPLADFNKDGEWSPRPADDQPSGDYSTSLVAKDDEVYVVEDRDI